jgi:hypothetical protein
MIVRQNLTGPQARELMPDRPADRSELLEFCRHAGRGLADILHKVPADTQAWTWSDDHTVRFNRRKQAHEALIHRIDAEVTAGDRTPMDPVLSADGVDEALRVMYSGVPDWGSFEPDPARTLRIQAADTGDSSVASPGRTQTGSPTTSRTSTSWPPIRAHRRARCSAERPPISTAGSGVARPAQRSAGPATMARCHNSRR